MQARDVLAYLLLLGGELVLIGRKLPEVPPHDREIDCDQLDLLRHFCRNGRFGSFRRAWRRQQPGQRRSPRCDGSVDLVRVRLPSQGKPDTEEHRREKPAGRSKHSVGNGGAPDCVWARRPPPALLVEIALSIEIARSKIMLTILLIGY